MTDQHPGIRVTIPPCVNCQRSAVGFVRWPKWVKSPQSWSPRCEQHLPWHDVDAEVVGIRLRQDGGER